MKRLIFAYLFALCASTTTRGEDAAPPASLVAKADSCGAKTGALQEKCKPGPLEAMLSLLITKEGAAW